MNNLDQAAEVIRRFARAAGGHPYSLAQALAAEGLLADDLPEPRITPTGCTFHEEGSPYGVDVTVYKTSDNEVYAYADDEFGTDLVSMPPKEARKMAARLLAAADYAERKTDD